jgi:hypothetical protein
VLAKVHRWHCPSVAELEFQGLLIDDGWDSNLALVKLFMVITTLLLSVIEA